MNVDYVPKHIGVGCGNDWLQKNSMSGELFRSDLGVVIDFRICNEIELFVC